MISKDDQEKVLHLTHLIRLELQKATQHTLKRELMESSIATSRIDQAVDLIEEIIKSNETSA